MLVHGVESGKHVAKIVRANGYYRGQADRAVHRIAAADPVPEAEHIRGIDAELADRVLVRRNGDEMARHRRIGAELLYRPPTRGRGIGHSLKRREGLRGDDKQGLRCIQIVRRLDEIGAVDIGDEPEAHRPVAVGPKRPVGHLGAEIGAADADVDDVADSSTGMAGPDARANLLGKGRHPVENLVDLRNHVVAVDLDPRASRGTQGDVKNGAFLGDIDLLAAEHLIPPGSDAARLRQAKE
jgi:hypothetical protein